MKQSLTNAARLFVTGATMGIADLIPGVSGGTIAFLSGIYEELLESIRIVSGTTLKLFLRGNIAAAVRSVPFSFLVPLGGGIGIAIFGLANVLSGLLHAYPVFVWAFFFGLVLASVFVVLQRVVRWDLSDRISFVVATTVTYFLVGAVPVEAPGNLPFMFLSGAIAVSAMILPGISGSFILLLLGNYQHILSAVVQRDLLTLAVFASGCVVGLSLFARFLSWLFARHHDISVAVLAGIMLGSIRKLWPWKEVIATRVNSRGDIVPLAENNIVPQAFDDSVLLAMILAAAGVAIVYALDRLKVMRERTEDIANTEFSAQHKRSLVSQRHTK